MIVRCIEADTGSTKDACCTIVGVKDIDDAITIGIVIGHIAIVCCEASRWSGFYSVGDKVVIAVQISKVCDYICIGINRNRTD